MNLKSPQNDQPLLLFDGYCNLCNASVKSVIKWDRRAIFQFASLQSDYAQNLLQKLAPDLTEMDSVVLVSRGIVFIKSDAVLEVARLLGGFPAILSVFKFIPKSVRDVLYAWIARKRYGWFGKRDACMIPTPELQNRFLS